MMLKHATSIYSKGKEGKCKYPVFSFSLVFSHPQQSTKAGTCSIFKEKGKHRKKKEEKR